jgi:hypothetical protein
MQNPGRFHRKILKQDSTIIEVDDFSKKTKIDIFDIV